MSAFLAIDTADRTVGVALLVSGQVVAEYIETSAYRHSERLFALIDEALLGAGLARDDLTAVAVTTGPGSFTGLRVGLATAKGLAFALGLPIVGISTLEALAWGAMPFPGTILPILDARKRQVYAAAFEGLDGEVLLPLRAWDPGELAARAAACVPPVLALGSGLGPYRSVLEEVLGNRLLCASQLRWQVPPGQVALLAARAVRAGRGLSPEAVVPAYLRRSEAEEAKDRRVGA
ncbi:MAG: tRNA (adenosine(37)-N6)-threonylcarbamoyltransferase complex dimerization subunit type 1 TsaB [Proteobacteria bacterium]|nr:tRNA (adenosine(37)-N6)-threonylcarbamoyltransferase complex dimerization subunit type 1 TsaB [Pseudomonadota bacterium]